MGAVKQTSLNDDAAANAGTKGDKDHVITVLSAALPVLTQSCHIGIVTGLHRETGEFTQGLGNVEHAPTQIYALIDNALAVHRPGNANTDSHDGAALHVILLHILLNRCGNVGQNLLSATGGDGGNLPLSQHGAIDVKICDLDGGSAQIYAKSVFHRVSS